MNGLHKLRAACFVAPAPCCPPLRATSTCPSGTGEDLCHRASSGCPSRRRRIGRNGMGERSSCPYPLCAFHLARHGPPPLSLSRGMVHGPRSNSVGAALARRPGELLSPMQQRPSSHTTAASGRPRCLRHPRAPQRRPLADAPIAKRESLIPAWPPPFILPLRGLARTRAWRAQGVRSRGSVGRSRARMRMRVASQAGCARWQERWAPAWGPSSCAQGIRSEPTWHQRCDALRCASSARRSAPPRSAEFSVPGIRIRQRHPHATTKSRDARRATKRRSSPDAPLARHSAPTSAQHRNASNTRCKPMRAKPSAQTTRDDAMPRPPMRNSTHATRQQNIR